MISISGMLNPTRRQHLDDWGKDRQQIRSRIEESSRVRMETLAPKKNQSQIKIKIKIKSNRV